jgi:hypothetical protein
MKKFNIVLVAALCASVQMFGMEDFMNNPNNRVVILDPSGKVVSDTHPERGTPNIKPLSRIYPEMPGYIKGAESRLSPTPSRSVRIDPYSMDPYSTIKK